MAPPIRPRYAALDVAADYLGGVDVKTIRRMIARGAITGYRFGHRLIRVDLNEIDAFMQRIPTVGGDAA